MDGPLAAGQNPANSINQSVDFDKLLPLFYLFVFQSFHCFFFDLLLFPHFLWFTESLSIPYNNNSGPKYVLQ